MAVAQSHARNVAQLRGQLILGRAQQRSAHAASSLAVAAFVYWARALPAHTGERWWQIIGADEQISFSDLVDYF